MSLLNVTSILNVRKGNFSWEIDFEKAKFSTSGSMKFNGGVDFEVKKFNDAIKNKQIIFGHCKIEININDTETKENLGIFKVNYHIEIEPTDELLADLENGKKNTEDEIRNFIMYILEPYFRYDFEKVMYDAELPKSIIPYGIFKKLNW